MKSVEYAEGYVNFYYDMTSSRWKAIFMNTPPSLSGSSPKYYKIKIPVPNEILVDDLPNQSSIEVSK